MLLGIILVTAMAVRRRCAVFSGTARALGRVPYLGRWIERKRSLIHSVENKLLDFYHETPGAFWGSFALNLACHGTAVFEVYLILWLMGVKVAFFTALAIEALTKLVNVVGTFNPGNIGTYEGGNMLIARMFHMSATSGLTLGLARRCRAIFWAGIGGVWLVMLSRRESISLKTSISWPVTRAWPWFLPATWMAMEGLGRCSPGLALSLFCFGQLWSSKGRGYPNHSCRGPSHRAFGAARVAEHPAPSRIGRMVSTRRCGHSSPCFIRAARQGR